MFHAFLGLVVLFWCNSGLAYNGVIEYEIWPQPEVGVKHYLIMSLRPNFVRFDLKRVSMGKDIVLSTAVADFNAKKLVGIKNERWLDYQIKPAKGGVPDVEEIVAYKDSKSVLGHPTRKHDLYFVINKERFPVEMWFAEDIRHEQFQRVDQLQNVSHFVFQYNYLFHPVTKQVALEMRANFKGGHVSTYRAIKITNEILSESYFKLVPPEKK